MTNANSGCSANLDLPGIPIAYPRMVFLENTLDSKLNPLTALGRSTGVLSGFVNKFNAEPELLDDLVCSFRSHEVVALVTLTLV